MVGETHSTFVSGYKLRKSYLLDSVTDTHVYNDQTRLTTMGGLKHSITLLSNTYAPIQGYGTVEAKPRSLDDSKTVIQLLKLS